MTKKELRQKYSDIRKNIENKRQKSLEMTETFIKTDTYKNARSIMLYYPKANEVNTLFLMEIAIKDKKELYFPVTDIKNGVIIPKKYESGFVKGAYGIYEPYNAYKEGKPDVVVVPALCVDSLGYRLGYGGGYYDRFLENYDGTKITFIFSELCTDKLPAEKFDIKTDIIITEKGE